MRQSSAALKSTPPASLRGALRRRIARFDEPLSGLLLAGERGGTRLLRSRSLWDAEAGRRLDKLSEGQTHYHQIEGPGGKLLLVAERRILFPTAQGGAASTVASDLTRLRQARDEFVGDLRPSLAGLALALRPRRGCSSALGLRPLRAGATGIAERRRQTGRRLPRTPRTKSLPLVREVNALSRCAGRDAGACPRPRRRSRPRPKDAAWRRSRRRARLRRETVRRRSPFARRRSAKRCAATSSANSPAPACVVAAAASPRKRPCAPWSKICSHPRTHRQRRGGRVSHRVPR